MMIMNETGVADDQLGRRLRMRLMNSGANDDDGDGSYWTMITKQGLPTTNLVVTRLVGLLLVVTLFHAIINRSRIITTVIKLISSNYYFFQLWP